MLHIVYAYFFNPYPYLSDSRTILCSEKMRKLLQVLKFTLIFFFINRVVISAPPEDPIKCFSKNTNCTITNASGIFPDRSTCKVGKAMYPTTEEELISIVASATKNKIKMKVATRFSHSIPKLVCPDGQKGLLISTNNLNKILKIDKEAKTMVVESGVTLREIISEAAKVGLALPYTPYWWGITIGGLIATGAHGSSLWGKGSAVHEYVVELRIVSPSNSQDGYVKVRSLNESDQDHLNAAKVSLGVLGVISQVTLQLESMFKRSLTYLMKDDTDLGDEIISFGRKHEFGDVTWYPSQHKVAYRIDDRVPINSHGDGLYDFIAFRPILSAELALTRAKEEVQEATGDANGKCNGAKLLTSTLASSGYGLTNNGLFLGYPIIGFNNRMQSSGSCLDSLNDGMITICPWEGQFYHQTSFSIPLSMVKNFIEDVQKLVELEPYSLCGLELNNGILMRYVTASSAYLGKTEDAVDFFFTYYRSKDPLRPRLFEDIVEEIEQIGLFKYRGLPHWGKNRNLGFVGAIQKYPNAEKFLKVKEEYDSLGLFSSEWTDQVLGLKEGVTILNDGCALEGLCICSQDSHCAPNYGYFCKPGRIYKDARVCAPRDVKKTEGQNVLKDEL
ncbi:PREDICTED: probable L-gulonolactone oxidase 6 isoform X2 [Lupinus angustifolius]|uniref:probable L-gulonolactone oxidase 6 isoform X2 n=1 Tax=Lupinus angustifolius TaxID=3871 RepID=UPI00092FC645|nr:PREDICTED: probable L-gulonolactone oxidase 6 isoform X2 [Lupinus angustifolius]